MESAMICHKPWFFLSRAIGALALSLSLGSVANAETAIATKSARESSPKIAAPRLLEAETADFPPELVNWKARPENPIFTAEGPGHWDVKIRERGWILRAGDDWQL